MQHNPLHYPTLDRCKKLTELGFPETQLHWSTLEQYRRPAEIMEFNIPGAVNYVCPSIVELLDIIPVVIFEKEDEGKGWEYGYQLMIHKRVCNRYDVFYIRKGKILFDVNYETLPNALADMVILLVKNKKLSIKK